MQKTHHSKAIGLGPKQQGTHGSQPQRLQSGRKTEALSEPHRDSSLPRAEVLTFSVKMLMFMSACHYVSPLGVGGGGGGHGSNTVPGPGLGHPQDCFSSFPTSQISQSIAQSESKHKQLSLENATFTRNASDYKGSIKSPS